MRMNEFISPHQNININISYNLGNQDKIPKVVFGKKIDKIVKSTAKEQPKSFFKIPKKSEDPVEPVQQVKKTKLAKKNKTKKKSNALLTLPDQQQPPRRLKTEGNTKLQMGNTFLKRQLKSNTKALSKTNPQHFKSLNNPPLYSHSKSQTKKPATSLTKQKKQQRRNSNKSCILYQQKKLLLSDVEHIISTTTNGPCVANKQPIKKRANSANVIKSDKFINRLLDMSVLTSELGGSIPMNEDKNRVSQNTNNRLKTALQEVMSSIDMRLIKKMEQDNQNKKCILVDFKVGEGLELISFLNKIRRIPIERLTEKAIKIQRFWRKMQTQTVMPYYSNMFFRNPAINSKAAIEQHLSQISGINSNGNAEEEVLGFHNSTGIRKKQEQAQFLSLISGPNLLQSSASQFEESSISAAKIRKMMENRPSEAKSSNLSGQISEKQQQWFIDQFQANAVKNGKSQKQQSSIDLQSSNRSNGLNIEKYRQLVKKQIEEQHKPVPKFTKNSLKLEQVQNSGTEIESKQPKQQNNNAEGSTQAHWNHVHNILSTNMNKKVPLMSKTVLEELMKQSAYNKQWVQGQFSNSQSRKISSKSSPRPQLGKEPLQTIAQKNQPEEGHNSGHANDYYFENQYGSEQDDENLSSSQYNWSKYSDISKLKKPQDITIPKAKQTQRQPQICKSMQNIPGLLPSGLKNNNLLQTEVQQYERMNGNKARPSRVVNIEQLELDDECIQEAEKHEKWIREQMIMEDGIVEKYLDCGLDCFGLNLNMAKNQQNQPEYGTIEQQQEKQVEQREQHKAALQKQYHANKNNKLEKQEKKNHDQHKDDDIFSNQAPSHQDHDDDMELVYVFQNTDGRRNRELKQAQHFDAEHATKNSKRNDNVNHLGNRDQINHQPNSNKNPNQSDISPQSLLQPSFSVPPGNEQEPYTVEQLSIQQELNTKRKQKISQQIITKLIEEFAFDVSLILRRSQNEEKKDSNNKLYKNQPNNQKSGNMGPAAAPNSGPQPNNSIVGLGIQTSFQSVRDFITKIKSYVLADEACCRKIINNLKNNIGPSSIEILSYLRIDDQNQFASEAEPEPEEEDNEEWLFVIPNDLFEVFNKKLLDEEEAARGKKLSNKFKLYTQFWHRSIFQCYNECLDYQRPYGITGAPYTWICQPKLPRPLVYSKAKVEQILESAENRLLELGCSSSGIIFDKPESPYREFQLSEQHKVQLNEQKISRMLANQIIDDEYNWITYNDEITELLVDITRKIEELLIFQVSTDMKKIMRRRKMMAHVGRNTGMEQSSSEDDQHAVFLVEDLV